jgi:hypothetical protein
MWEPRRLTTLWAFTACYRDSFTFLLHILNKYDLTTAPPLHRISSQLYQPTVLQLEAMLYSHLYLVLHNIFFLQNFPPPNSFISVCFLNKCYVPSKSQHSLCNINISAWRRLWKRLVKKLNLYPMHVQSCSESLWLFRGFSVLYWAPGRS